MCSLNGEIVKILCPKFFFKTYHIAICDDDASYIQYTKNLFLQEKTADEHLIFYEYLSGEELLNDLAEKEKCDLLFLDVQLGGIDGNITAREFRKLFPDSLLIFCSGVYLPTVESFEPTPFRYLLKSYSQTRMSEEIEQIYKKMRIRSNDTMNTSNQKLTDTIEIFNAMMSSSQSVIEVAENLKQDLSNIISVKEQLFRSMEHLEQISRNSAQTTTEISLSYPFTFFCSYPI